MKHILILLALFTFVGGSVQSTEAAYFVSGDNPQLATEIKDDTFAAGQNVSVSAPVAGELFVAGNAVSITKASLRSVFAAGRTVTLEQGAGYNAFVAGQTVVLSGHYGHDVYAAAANITIKDGTVIDGELRAAGDSVTLAGTIAGNVTISANHVTSGAVIGGSFADESEKLSFTGGSVAKDLTYTTPSLAVDLNKVVVSGKTEHTDQNPSTPKADLAGLAAFAGALTFASWFYRLLTSLVIGAAFLLILPKKVLEVTGTIRSNWAHSLLIGLLGLFLGPFVIILIFATLIGWKLALAALLLYIAWLMIAPVYAIFIVGEWLLKRLGDTTPNRWAVLLVGALVVAIVSGLPFLGLIFQPIVFITLVVPALGATLTWLKNHAA